MVNEISYLCSKFVKSKKRMKNGRISERRDEKNKKEEYEKKAVRVKHGHSFRITNAKVKHGLHASSVIKMKKKKPH